MSDKNLSFLDEVSARPGGEDIRSCIQCGICSGSCPMADKMEHTPRQIIAMVRAGMRDEVLSSSSQWQCLSCYLCSARCPREVKPAEIMHVLECMAIDEGRVSKKTRTPIMYRSFVDTIKANGRIHELGFMIRYYLRTNLFAALRLTGMALNMLSRGRIPLRAHKIKGKNELNLILDKARSWGGKQ